MELSEPTLRHYLNLCQHRRGLLEGVSLVAFRHMSHLMSAMSRLGLDVLNDEQSLKRILDLIFEDQGNPSGTYSRPMVTFINMMPWEMYLCLLYVELEGYRTASNRDPSLAFRPLDELLVQKAAVVENLKTMRDKVLHPAKRIDLGDAHASFLDSARLVDGHHYQTASDLQRRLDMHVLWLGTSLIKHGIDEVTAAAKSGREIEPARLDLLQRARIAFNAPPPFFDNAYDPTARQTPFDVQHWAILGLYQEVRLDAPSGPHPDFLRRTKTDAMRMLMRSLVFANERMHLIDPGKAARVQDARRTGRSRSCRTSPRAASRNRPGDSEPLCTVAHELRVARRTVAPLPPDRRAHAEPASASDRRSHRAGRRAGGNGPLPQPGLSPGRHRRQP